MTTGLYKKGLVLDIICLFIGAGVLPSISGDINDNENTEIKDFVNVVSLLPDDELDQSQDKSDAYFAIAKSQGNPPQSPLSNAQSFWPSLNILTKVNLFLYKAGSPDYNSIKVSIRDSQSTNELVSTTKVLNNMPSGTN